MQAEQTVDKKQPHSSHGEWAIVINGQNDARRYAQLAAWAGFAWVVVATLIGLFILKMGMKQFLGKDVLDPQKVQGMTFAMIALGVRFVLYALGSFVAGMAKGLPSILASIFIFILFCTELVVATAVMISKTMFMGIIAVAPLLVLAYVLWAGVIGNWQNRKFIKGQRQ